jgi:hypothetical protein
MTGGLAVLRWQAWLSSAILHGVGLVVLSLLILSMPMEEPTWLSADMGDLDVIAAEDLELDSTAPLLDGPDTSLGPILEGDEVSLPGARADAIGVPGGSARATTPIASGIPVENLQAIGSTPAGHVVGLENALASLGGGLEGRHLENRRAAALAGGGTEASESAVERALEWFAAHQWADGGWRFDLEKCPNCAGYCRNSGTHTSSTAATGLALLSFLGAGYTPNDGKYADVVAKGLYFLRERMRITSFGGDLRDSAAALEGEQPLGLLNAVQLQAIRRDSMYSHGIATLALTEAYAMTRSKEWRDPAEQAIKFIVNAQYEDGGWRYVPAFEAPGPGDMTVTGWQLAALKSGVLAGIDVPYDVWRKAREFMDGLQEDGGATYVYMQGRPATAATTACGLLGRMVTGWTREHRPLVQGVARVAGQAPERNNMYFNYYAAQVLHHFGGPQWEKWNPRMRDYLVSTQSNEGHEAGSWYFTEPHSTPGGRLYTTAMATMTLEVYYRYMPLYQENFVQREP